MAGSDRGRAARRLTVDKGIDWLQSREDAGRWSSFRTLAGTSEVWVTGFVGAHMQAIQPRSPHLAATRRFLSSQQQDDGGWGFGAKVPSDADSTAWCLSVLGRSRSFSAKARQRAESFLARHEAARGYSTYSADSGIRQFIGANADQSLAGWTSPHSDVTAAVLVTRPHNARSVELLRALVSRQSSAGIIESYWWRSPYYALSLTLRAMRAFKLRPTDEFIGLALENLDGKQLADGGYALGSDLTADAFTTALALEAYCHLARFARAGKISRVASALQQMQSGNGSWPGNWVLRIPSPSVVSLHSVHHWTLGSGGGNAFVKDEAGVFATTLACHALHMHGQLQDGRDSSLNPSWRVVEARGREPDENVTVVIPIRPPEIELCDMQAHPRSP